MRKVEAFTGKASRIYKITKSYLLGDLGVPDVDGPVGLLLLGGDPASLLHLEDAEEGEGGSAPHGGGEGAQVLTQQVNI